MRLRGQVFDQTLTVPFANDAAAGAQIDGAVFVSDGYYELVEARVNHTVNGGAGAVADITKITPGTAIASGVSMLATTFALNTGALTPQRRAKSASTLSATPANRQLSPGDSVVLNFGGTLTALEGVGGVLVFARTRSNPDR